MRIRRWVLFLGLILFLASFLRLYKLNSLELFGDEIDVGYQAYSILKTGRDLRGYRFPLYFHSLSESRAPLYLYATVPFIAVLGLNEWGVRIPAAFFGLLNILLVAWLIKILFKEEKLSLLSAFVLAILPWHIQYSRAAFEVTLLLTLVLLGLILFFKSLSNSQYLLPFSILTLILSLYVYSAAVLFVPTLLLLLFLIWFPSFSKFKKKYLVFSMGVFFVAILPLLVGSLSGQSQERFSRVSIFSDKKIIERIILKRGWEGSWGRVFHNKITEIGKQFITNYLTAFSPQFLFLIGDPNSRHSAGGIGEIYLVFLPFLLWGIVDCFSNIKRKENLFTVGWLAISPVASAMTIEGGNHSTRLFLMLPPLVVLISKGINRLLTMRKNYQKLLVLVFGGFFLCNLCSYLHQYYVHYQRESWQFWHFGYKEAIKKLSSLDSRYNRVVINNSHEPILIRFLFWGKKDPSWFRNHFIDDKDIAGVLGDFAGFKLGKYFFVKPKTGMGFLELLDKATLYLAFQGDDIPGDWDFEKKPPEGVKVLETIRTPLGDPYIYLLTGK